MDEIEVLLRSLLENRHNSKGPFYQTDALGSTKQFPAGTNVNNPLEDDSGRLLTDPAKGENEIRLDGNQKIDKDLLLLIRSLIHG